MARTKQISEQEATAIFKTKCKQFAPFRILYRGLSHSFDYGFIDPSKSNSIMTENDSYYSFLVDWFWKKFPKRAKSVICTPDRSVASNFGNNIYIVIPFDNSTFGITPSQDFWNGFKYVSKNLGLRDMLAFDKMLGELIGKPVAPRPLFFKLLTNITPTMNDKEKLKGILAKVKGKQLKYEKFLEYIYKSKKDFKTTLMDLLDPSKNGFDLKRYNTIHALLFKSDKELWTNDKCLLINERVFVDFINADYNNQIQTDQNRRTNSNNLIAQRRVDKVKKDGIMDKYTALRVKQTENNINSSK